MMHHNATNAARLPTLVDTFSSGFRALNRALLVLIIPLLVDFWLWLGPRLSIRPLLESLRRFDPTTWDQMMSQLNELYPAEQSFYLGVLLPFWRRLHIFGTPTDAAHMVEPGTWFVGNVPALLGIVLLINLAVTLLTVVYLLPLADVVRGGVGQGQFVVRILRTWLRILGAIGIVLGILTIVGIPLMAVAIVMYALVPAIGSAIIFLVFGLAIWLTFSTSFAYDAILLDGVGPIAALLASMAIIRRYFWGAVGFFLLQTFILLGLGFIWSELITTVVGVVIALLTSAYVGAGIAAAHLIFFRDRMPRMANLPQA